MAEVYSDFIAVKHQYENIFTQDGLKIIRNYISDSIKRLKEFEGYEIMTKALSDELQSIENDIDNRDRIVLLRLLQTIDNRINQIKHLKTLQKLMQDYTAVHENVVQENEERRMKKFNSKLFADIDSATRDITDQIAEVSDEFFKSFAMTDKEVLQRDIPLYCSQQSAGTSLDFAPCNATSKAHTLTRNVRYLWQLKSCCQSSLS